MADDQRKTLIASNIETRRMRVLKTQLRDGWHARECAIPISPIPRFTHEGLVLGAGTVLIAAGGPRRQSSLEGQEARVLALLSAAYGRPVAPCVLGNVKRAAKSWSEGDDCLAYIHLAHAGLQSLHDFRAGAYRLHMAHCAMKHGASPRAVLEALHLDARYIDSVEKLYNPEEPRVPAGSGRISGQWTRLLSWIGGLDAAEALELGLYAARVATPVGGAAAVLGLLFIPSPNNAHVEGEVPGVPGLRFSWNRDEAKLFLKYDCAGGAQRTVAIQLDRDKLRDERGEVVGHIIGGNRVAIDTIAVLPDLVKQDEPRLCPAPAPDVAGSDQGKPYEENRSRQYEDFVKLLINPPPDGPTPSGFVYYLPNPKGGEPANYDGCKRANGTLFEIKGERYAELLKSPPIIISITKEFLLQSGRQIAASGGRPIVWIFAEEDAARFARALFDDADKGREDITVGYVPWTKREP
jgi:hypothetical protein